MTRELLGHIKEKIHSWFCKVSDRLKSTNSMCVHLCCNGSTMFPSKVLWDTILKDHPTDSAFFVLFTKLNNGSEYAFFVNPEWEKHGIDDPRMLMTQQIVYHSGKIGAHIYQPSVHEIMWKYGIKEDCATIKVKRKEFNGEPYYLLEK